MTIRKTLIASVIATSAITGVAFAQDATSSNIGTSVEAQAVVNSNPEITAIRAKIDELKQKAVDLRAQVNAGTITADQAKATWQTLIDELRAMKQKAFDNHVAKMENRFKGLEQKDPEMASKLEAKMDALKNRRTQMKAEEEKLRAEVKAGTITRQAANEQRKALFASTTAKVVEARKEMQAEREDRREDRKAEVEARVEDRQEKKGLLQDVRLKLRLGGDDHREAPAQSSN